MVFRSPVNNQAHLFGIGWGASRASLLEAWTPIERFKPLENTRPPRFEAAEPTELGRWYSRKVSVRGRTVRAMADGNQQLQSDCCLSESGRVGVRTWRIWPGRTVFRNILVTAPDGTVLLKGPPEL
jgi:hypothetical protein